MILTKSPEKKLRLTSTSSERTTFVAKLRICFLIDIGMKAGHKKQWNSEMLKRNRLKKQKNALLINLNKILRNILHCPACKKRWWSGLSTNSTKWSPQNRNHKKCLPIIQGLLRWSTMSHYRKAANSSHHLVWLAVSKTYWVNQLKRNPHWNLS